MTIIIKMVMANPVLVPIIVGFNTNESIIVFDMGVVLKFWNGMPQLLP